MRKKILFLLLFFLVTGIGVGIWAYFTPYEFHVEQVSHRKLYENDLISKKDFLVYTTSRLGKKVIVEDYRINTDTVSETGLIAFSQEELGFYELYDLNSTPIISSDITYNTVCYEDQTASYQSNIVETVTYEDGRVDTWQGEDLNVEQRFDSVKNQVRLHVHGKNDFYSRSFDMITITSLTTKNKASIRKKLSSKKLKMTIHYSDGTKRKADSKKIKCDVIKKPKKGINKLKCYYNNKSFVVKVKGYDPDPYAGKPHVTFPGHGTYILQYSAPYDVEDAYPLTASAGVRYFNNHRETYYSTSELGGRGTSYYIPGKHVAEDGTIRDEDGFICVAADYGFASPHEIVLTTLGPGKVYDTGCRYGTIDIYVTW